MRRTDPRFDREAGSSLDGSDPGSSHRSDRRVISSLRKEPRTLLYPVARKSDAENG
jgi:hypothetical protein